MEKGVSAGLSSIPLSWGLKLSLCCLKRAIRILDWIVGSVMEPSPGKCSFDCFHVNLRGTVLYAVFRFNTAKTHSFAACYKPWDGRFGPRGSLKPKLGIFEYVPWFIIFEFSLFTAFLAFNNNAIRLELLSCSRFPPMYYRTISTVVHCSMWWLILLQSCHTGDKHLPYEPGSTWREAKISSKWTFFIFSVAYDFVGHHCSDFVLVLNCTSDGLSALSLFVVRKATYFSGFNFWLCCCQFPPVALIILLYICPNL